MNFHSNCVEQPHPQSRLSLHYPGTSTGDENSPNGAETHEEGGGDSSGERGGSGETSLSSTAREQVLSGLSPCPPSVEVSEPGAGSALLPAALLAAAAHGQTARVQGVLVAQREHTSESRSERQLVTRMETMSSAVDRHFSETRGFCGMCAAARSLPSQSGACLAA